MILTRPRKFQGTEAQKQANRASHYFVDGHCVDCDCKPWHETANYPCGGPVPRERIER